MNNFKQIKKDILKNGNIIDTTLASASKTKQKLILKTNIINNKLTYIVDYLNKYEFNTLDESISYYSTINNEFHKIDKEDILDTIDTIKTILIDDSENKQKIELEVDLNKNKCNYIAISEEDKKIYDTLDEAINYDDINPIDDFNIYKNNKDSDILNVYQILIENFNIITKDFLQEENITFNDLINPKLINDFMKYNGIKDSDFFDLLEIKLEENNIDFNLELKDINGLPHCIEKEDNMFHKFNFKTPKNKNVELFKKFDNEVFGVVFSKDNKVSSAKWDSNTGKCITHSDYDLKLLKPIKKKEKDKNLMKDI